MITVLILSVAFFLVLVFLKTIFLDQSKGFFSKPTWRDRVIKEAKLKRLKRKERNRKTKG